MATRANGRTSSTLEKKDTPTPPELLRAMVTEAAAPSLPSLAPRTPAPSPSVGERISDDDLMTLRCFHTVQQEAEKGVESARAAVQMFMAVLMQRHRFGPDDKVDTADGSIIRVATPETGK